jgi:hypothetical protein
VVLSKAKSLISILLRLEIINLVIFLLFSLILLSRSEIQMHLILFLVVASMEAAVGLALFVGFILL